MVQNSKMDNLSVTQPLKKKLINGMNVVPYLVLSASKKTTQTISLPTCRLRWSFWGSFSS